MALLRIFHKLQNTYCKIVMAITLTLFLLAGYPITLFFKRERRLHVWYKIAKICLFVTFLLCFIRIRTHNLDNIPKKTCVIAMNHRSFMDTLSMIVMLDKYFFVLTEPFDALPHPIIKEWVSNLSYIPVIRDEKDKRNFREGLDPKYVVKECVERVKKGETLVIYPEAHHEMHMGLLKFRTGAVRIALEAKVPLIPGAFTGTERVITPEYNKIHPGKVHLRFDKALDIERYYDMQNDFKLVKELTKELKKKIGKLIP